MIIIFVCTLHYAFICKFLSDMKSTVISNSVIVLQVPIVSFHHCIWYNVSSMYCVYEIYLCDLHNSYFRSFFYYSWIFWHFDFIRTLFFISLDCIILFAIWVQVVLSNSFQKLYLSISVWVPVQSVLCQVQDTFF